jgi:hypothetical protein
MPLRGKSAAAGLPSSPTQRARGDRKSLGEMAGTNSNLVRELVPREGFTENALGISGGTPGKLGPIRTSGYSSLQTASPPPGSCADARISRHGARRGCARGGQSHQAAQRR